MGRVEIVLVGLGAVACLLLLRAVVRREPDRFIAKVVVVAVLAKAGGTLAYFTVLRTLYEGGDADGYVRAGRQLAPIIRSGSLPEHASQTGTRFMEFLTGVVFAVTGSNEIVGYAVFSGLAFVGMYLFFQAFRLAVPEGDHRRYAVLVLLLPTMLFWPSTIGKEPWLVFTLGVAAYGAARLLRAERWGLFLVAVGGAGIFAIRPHMAALLAVSLVGAALLRLGDRDVQQHLAGWLAGILLVSVAAGFALARFSDEMGRTETEGTLTERVVADTDEVFERTSRLTREGGSEFDSRPVRSPGDLVHALVTVPFRPFPNETHNWQALLMSLEGLAMLVLVVVALPRIVRLPHLALRRPYVAFAAVYCLGFVVAFSNVGNFGILVRQRAQLLPFLIVLLALPRLGSRLGPTGRPARRDPRRRSPVVVVAPPSGSSSNETDNEHADSQVHHRLPSDTSSGDRRKTAS